MLTEHCTQILPAEMKDVVAGFTDKGRDKLQANGLYIAKEKFLVVKADDRSIYGKKVLCYLPSISLSTNVSSLKHLATIQLTAAIRNTGQRGRHNRQDEPSPPDRPPSRLRAVRQRRQHRRAARRLPHRRRVLSVAVRAEWAGRFSLRTCKAIVGRKKSFWGRWRECSFS